LSILTDAVKKLEDKIAGSGCDHGTVSFKKTSGSKICPYVKGECIAVAYGGKNCEMVTSHPLEVATKISFMYGKPLNTSVQRTAACAIINVLSNFMCFTRIAGACDESSHEDCLNELKIEIGGSKVYLNGNLAGLSEKIKESVVENPDDADIIIVSGDGLFEDDKLAVTEKYRDSKRLIFTGPATVGVCIMENLEHWCPYGKK